MVTATAALNETRTPLLGGNPDAPYLVPRDGTFGGDFMPADDLRRVGTAIMEAHPVRFGFLRDVAVAYLWKRKGGKSAGKTRLGKCVKASGLVRYLAHDTDFIIWIAADTARDFNLTSRQVEAAVYHEMMHIGQDDEGRVIAVGHDFEGFGAELEAYGPWSADLKLAVDMSAQIPIFQYDYPEEDD